MSPPEARGIGGYFSREPLSQPEASPLHPDAVRFQSARCAIAAALSASRRTRAWLPNFICPVVYDALSWAGVSAVGYPLGPDLGPPPDLEVMDDDWLICVNYFGISGAACDSTIRRYGPDRVLVDASQAIFHPADLGAVTVYSPRKFVGVPDGGLLVAPFPAGPSLPADEEASRTRSRHLDSRAAGMLAEGYEEFRAAEDSLRDCTPRAMSSATANALDHINWNTIGTRRRENYRTLAGFLSQAGWPLASLPDGAVPLCLPLATRSAARLRAAMAQDGIFCPSYWPDIEPPAGDKVATALRFDTLFLPCDQRYGPDDMLRIAETLERHRGIP